ncbi:hypothetical protein D3C86_970340 [compost metagenome]
MFCYGQSMRNRTTVQNEPSPGTPLGRVLRDYRWLFRLTQRDAAKVLGIGYSTLQSYESGVDLKTKLPINPRDNTLEILSRRMVEYAEKQDQPLGKSADQVFLELMVAAGKLPAEEKIVEARGEEPKPAPVVERAKLKLLDGGIDGRFEPTEDELKIIQQAEEEDVWFGILSQPGFWDDPPEDRRSTFRYLEGLIDEARRFKRRQSTK